MATVIRTEMDVLLLFIVHVSICIQKFMWYSEFVIQIDLLHAIFEYGLCGRVW